MRPVVTIRELWHLGKERLKVFPWAALEARILLQKAASLDEREFFLYSDESVSPAIARRYERLLDRRLAGCPLALITGEREFWSLPFRIKRGVFIPRPETELLIEQALALPWSEDGIGVDIGTGCGAIACALARERPRATIVATDISPAALRLARENAERLQIKNIIFALGSLFSPLQSLGLEGRCDLVVSNPPYVTEEEWLALSSEIKRYEPRRALVAGKTGLEFILRLIRDAPLFLRPGGFLLFEIGYGQLDEVVKALSAAGWDELQWEKDLAGIPRAISARLSSSRIRRN